MQAFGGSSAPFERRKRPAAIKTLFEELAESAEQEVRRAHKTLREMHVHEIFHDHRSVDVRVPECAAAAAVIRVETADVRRFPFPFQAVAREWWKFISQSSQLEQIVDGLSRVRVHLVALAAAGLKDKTRED